MRIPVLLVAVFFIFQIAGCVSSQKYNTSVADNEALRSEVETLKGMLEEADKRYNNLQSENSMLMVKANKLEAKERDLREANASLKQLIEASKLELTMEAADLRKMLDENVLRVRALEDSLKKAKYDQQVAETMLRDSNMALEILRREKMETELETTRAVEDMKKTYEALVSELKGEIEDGRIAVTSLRGKLSLSMVDKILFDSGSADINKGGRQVLDRVAEILKKVSDKHIRVEGHTDNVPISRRLMDVFPTNWELSSRRATNVVRYLEDKAGIDPNVLSIGAYGEHKPIAPNDTEEGKARNRRIEIVLIPPEISEPVPAEAGAQTDVQAEGQAEGQTDTPSGNTGEGTGQ